MQTPPLIPEDEQPSILEQYQRSSNAFKPLISEGYTTRFFYNYLNKLYSLSSRTAPFSFSQLYNVDKEINSDELIDKFEKSVFKEMKENDNPDYFDLIVKEVWPTMKIGFYLMFFGSIIQTPVPMLLKWYLQWFKSDS